MFFTGWSYVLRHMDFFVVVLHVKTEVVFYASTCYGSAFLWCLHVADVVSCGIRTLSMKLLLRLR